MGAHESGKAIRRVLLVLELLDESVLRLGESGEAHGCSTKASAITGWLLVLGFARRKRLTIGKARCCSDLLTNASCMEKWSVLTLMLTLFHTPAGTPTQTASPQDEFDIHVGR